MNIFLFILFIIYLLLLVKSHFLNVNKHLLTKHDSIYMFESNSYFIEVKNVFFSILKFSSNKNDLIIIIIIWLLFLISVKKRQVR